MHELDPKDELEASEGLLGREHDSVGRTLSLKEILEEQTSAHDSDNLREEEELGEQEEEELGEQEEEVHVSDDLRVEEEQVSERDDDILPYFYSFRLNKIAQ